MHILIIPSENFVTKKNPLGGIFQYDQAKALSKAGHKTGVISVGFITLRHLFQSYPYEKCENSGTLTIFRMYKRSFLLERFVPPAVNIERSLNLFKSLYAEYEEHYGQPDVVHAHNFFYAGFHAKWLFEQYGIPFILTEHSSAFVQQQHSHRRDDALKNVAERAGVLSCVSTHLKFYMQRRFGFNFCLLPNIVDFSFFEEPLGCSASKEVFVFLTVGSLDKNKNQSLLLRAFADGFKRKSALLRIAGEGSLRSELEKLSKYLGIVNQVRFLGQIPREKVLEEMQSAHCFVLPSNYETFGVVLIEALACGLPLIATRSGGPEDIVNPGNGLLIDVGSKRQLIDAMRFIRQNLTSYDRQQLRDEARSKFGEEAFVKNTVALYEKAIYDDRRH